MFEPAHGVVESPSDQVAEPASSALPEPEPGEILDSTDDPETDPGMEFLVWPA